MDRKSILILIVCVALFASWSVLVNKLYPPTKLPPGFTNAPAAMTSTGTNHVPAASNVTSASSPASSIPRTFTPADAPEELIVVSNDNTRYTFTSHGGGIKLIELVHYPETVQRRGKAAAPSDMAALNAHAPLPVLASLGGASVQDDGVFTLTKTATGVRAEKTLPNGLAVVKEFQLGTNYLLAASVRLANTSTQAIALPEQEWVVGTATPMGPYDDGTGVGLVWYNGDKTHTINQSWFGEHGFLFFKSAPRWEYRDASNVVWAASHNQFFALVAMPQGPAPGLLSLPVEFPSMTNSGNSTQTPRSPKSKGVQTALVYPPQTLEPGQSLERRFEFFAGPKEFQALARLSARFNNDLDQVMGFNDVWPFYRVGGFFAKLLLLGMNWLHGLLHLGYGWVIIIITVIVKVVFWPLTQASTRSMKRMQALQPQMKAIQAKYKDDPAKMNRKTMEFMRENKVSPLGGCLPMLLQIPVFAGFFTMIRTAIELRGASWLWISDLSKPDTLFIIPGLEVPFNLLPLLMGVTMLWQARMTPPSPGMDPAQQKIMKYMPLMFLFMLYNFSAALTLYWTVQNLLTIAQMKLTKAQPETATTSSAAPKKKK